MPDFSRSDVPRDHPLQKTFTPTDVKRTKEAVDDIFDFGGSPLERDDIEVNNPGSTGAAKVEPAGFLADEEFESFTEQAKESEVLGWNPMTKTNYAKENQLPSESPFEAHTDRSTEAAQQDTRRKARVTTDPLLYASDPDSYDYPFLDTPTEFKEEFGDESWRELEERAGPDDIFTW